MASLEITIMAQAAAAFKLRFKNNKKLMSSLGICLPPTIPLISPLAKPGKLYESSLSIPQHSLPVRTNAAIPKGNVTAQHQDAMHITF